MEAAIKYNPTEKRFDTPWGWVKLNFNTGDVQVYGPGVEQWFNAKDAVKTAALFAPYAHTAGDAVVLAIHQQYAAWHGARTLVRA